ncbi:MAG: hypothetical protein FJ244_00325 [Nitrospira sp.]|nr:hypothetical protein [Nitrospira sp.]
MAKPLKTRIVEVPADLLTRATTARSNGVTSTARRGLTLVASGAAYSRLRRFRGTVKFRIKLVELRLEEC